MSANLAGRELQTQETAVAPEQSDDDWPGVPYLPAGQMPLQRALRSPTMPKRPERQTQQHGTAELTQVRVSTTRDERPAAQRPLHDEDAALDEDPYLPEQRTRETDRQASGQPSKRTEGQKARLLLAGGTRRGLRRAACTVRALTTALCSGVGAAGGTVRVGHFIVSIGKAKEESTL